MGPPYHYDHIISRYSYLRLNPTITRKLHSPAIDPPQPKQKKLRHDVEEIRKELESAHLPNKERKNALPKLPIIADDKILQAVFTHRTAKLSPDYDAAECYERYELVGDSVLNFFITAILSERFKSLSEGQITKMYSNKLKKNLTFAEISLKYGLSKYVLPEKANKTKPIVKLNADLLEAYAGGVCADCAGQLGRLEKLKRWLRMVLKPYIDEVQNSGKINYKEVAKLPQFSQLNASYENTASFLEDFTKHEVKKEKLCAMLYTMLCPHSKPNYKLIGSSNVLGEGRRTYTVACVVRGEVLSIVSSSSFWKAKTMAAKKAMVDNIERVIYYRDLNIRHLRGDFTIEDYPVKMNESDESQELGSAVMLSLDPKTEGKDVQTPDPS